MRPLQRRSRGTVQTNHENRIQTLERRIPEDWPQFASGLLDVQTIDVADTPGTFEFGWAFPDDPCELPDCDPDDWHQDGNYLLLPQGYQGPFWITMQASCLGGCAELENYLEPVDLGDTTPTNMLRLWCYVEIWRDNEPFGDTTTSAAVFGGQHPPSPVNFLTERVWWFRRLHPGHGLLDLSRDRYALLPVFSLNPLSGSFSSNVMIGGLVLTVEMFPPTPNALPGFSA